jgi:cyclopropane fatty-acyl-phospholipid synthase-like methyltransferase
MISAPFNVTPIRGVSHPAPLDLSPDRIFQVGLGFWAAKALLSAVELGLFTVLAAEPLDAKALRRRLGIHERGARDFFDALVALRMLDRQDGLYRNTPEANLYLDRNKPSYLGGFLDHVNTALYPSWALLTDALRTGKPQSRTKDTANYFHAAYTDPEFLAAFTQAMTGASMTIASTLARRFAWNGYRSLIDIGAAEGGALVQIARAHPHLNGGGFDLPVVRAVFETYVRRHGLDDRLRFYRGDFFNDALPSAEVLLMGHILHDWDLATKRMLLAKAHAALPPGGALIVYDQMIDDERRTNASGLLMSLNMLVATPGGFDYTGTDCISWMREAGFRDVRIEHLRGHYSMVIGTK